ncbi:putative UBX domain-containing protein 10 [Glarea lozoyensis 74030]|uniref:Putative UBX domain-containing protein 10 n=1 Tax=Glarea lozoyensis (strain ATCC 74030 / MF5533) TaxID=1104152 RepID=H0EKA9_GLAL7|nr:putative UBX domain-containing protein 10 [Glarea lozoyensis 74030]
MATPDSDIITDQDVRAAIPLLRRSQWNVEIAVAKFFDGEGPDLVAEALAAQNVPPPRAPRQENLQQSLLHGQREFTEEYGENSLPWTSQGYATSLDQTKREYGFLLVILLSPEHDDTTSFCREVLMNAEVTSFLNDPTNTMRVWIGDLRDSEAYQVSTALKCTKFPFSALICNTPEISSTSISVVSRLTGPMTASTYLSKLRAAHAARASQLETGRVAHNLQNSERNLRAEQDQAYERSLAQDRERARQRREAEAAAAAAEKARLDAERNATLLAEKRKAWRKWRASKVKPEPGLEEKEIVRIALKLPEAARVMRKFRASDEIEELYAFVECYEDLQAGITEEVEKPEGYEHEFGFRIVSTLPRVVYDVKGGGTIGEKVGRSGNLIVESIFEGEEEEGE